VGKATAAVVDQTPILRQAPAEPQRILLLQIIGRDQVFARRGLGHARASSHRRDGENREQKQNLDRGTSDDARPRGGVKSHVMKAHKQTLYPVNAGFSCSVRLCAGKIWECDGRETASQLWRHEEMNVCNSCLVGRSFLGNSFWSAPRILMIC